MHIEKLTLRDFKRFRELTIDLTEAQPPPKLVLLIGANGSGKSAVFDALEWVSIPFKGGQSVNPWPEYYRKGSEAVPEAECFLAGGRRVYRRGAPTEAFDNSSGTALGSAFYGRSASRQVPQLTRRRSQPLNVELDEDRPRLYILPDPRFENDIDLVTGRILAEVFRGNDFDAATLRHEYIDPINDALQRIFRSSAASSLALTQLIPSLANEPADVRFRKGVSEIHYDLLSSGEKEVFNIVLNLFARRELYRDTVYFIDELDVHLHTALQYGLIQEIVEHWIPDGCQLWTASHSLGFVQYAKETEHSVIIDLDELDFDLPHTLVPAPRHSMEVFDIVVPKDMALELLPQKRLMLCENNDAKLYNALGLTDTIFIGRRDKNAVGIEMRANDRYFGLIDRDYLGDDEIAWIRTKHPRLFVLGYYAIENYLYHPDNYAELVPGFDVQGYREHIRQQKDAALVSSLLNLQKTRESYEIIKEREKKEKRAAEEAIAAALASSDFETFYPFFDMKSKFDRSALARHQIPPDELARTRWMRAQIEQRLR
jgi:energy-coupling factor transporter ATP-binding protein EcfA2